METVEQGKQVSVAAAFGLPQGVEEGGVAAGSGAAASAWSEAAIRAMG